MPLTNSEMGCSRSKLSNRVKAEAGKETDSMGSVGVAMMKLCMNATRMDKKTGLESPSITNAAWAKLISQ